MQKKTIGRAAECDYVILDPKNRVSRKHIEMIEDNGHFFVIDLNSTNGTYINGNKIPPGKRVEIDKNDKITLSVDYLIEPRKIFKDPDDSTRVLNQPSVDDATIILDKEKVVFEDNEKTIVFDRDKTQIKDISEIDNSPFITLGRNPDNKVVVSDVNISRYHCRMRLLNPIMVEIEDLGSTNGTFADEERLTPKVKQTFSSSVNIRLGKDYNVDLKKVFPKLQVLQRPATSASNFQHPSPADKRPLTTNQNIQNRPATKEELSVFYDLEDVWKEYMNRQNQASKAMSGLSIGGAVFGLAAAAFTGATGGIGGILLMSGGGIIGRYLGQQKSNKIRSDLSYEDAFLQVYACPRCKESFQKKPWVTIRECNKCKLKFRE